MTSYRAAVREMLLLVVIGYATFFGIVGLALAAGYAMGVTLT